MVFGGSWYDHCKHFRKWYGRLLLKVFSHLTDRFERNSQIIRDAGASFLIWEAWPDEREVGIRESR